MAKTTKTMIKFTKADLTAILTIAVTLLWQFGTYFLAKSFALNPHVVVDEIDNFIPLIKQFIIFYVIWYFMIVIVPFIISRRDRTSFHVYIFAYNLMFVAALITFYFYPTIMKTPQFESTDFWSYCLNWLYTNDYPPVNCIPSGHAMACCIMLYGTLMCKNLKKPTKMIIVVLCLLTIASTVLIKQHAFIDLVIAFIYATIAMIVSWFVWKKIIKKS